MILLFPFLQLLNYAVYIVFNSQITIRQITIYIINDSPFKIRKIIQHPKQDSTATYKRLDISKLLIDDIIRQSNLNSLNQLSLSSSPLYKRFCTFFFNHHN